MCPHQNLPGTWPCFDSKPDHLSSITIQTDHASAHMVQYPLRGCCDHQKCLTLCMSRPGDQRGAVLKRTFEKRSAPPYIAKSIFQKLASARLPTWPARETAKVLSNPFCPNGYAEWVRRLHVRPYLGSKRSQVDPITCQATQRSYFQLRFLNSTTITPAAVCKRLSEEVGRSYLYTYPQPRSII